MKKKKPQRSARSCTSLPLVKVGGTVELNVGRMSTEPIQRSLPDELVPNDAYPRVLTLSGSIVGLDLPGTDGLMFPWLMVTGSKAKVQSITPWDPQVHADSDTLRMIEAFKANDIYVAPRWTYGLLIEEDNDVVSGQLQIVWPALDLPNPESHDPQVLDMSKKKPLPRKKKK